MPPPVWIGATTTAARFMCGVTSGTAPVTITDSLAAARSSAGGLGPTITTRARGCAASTRGAIRRASLRAASTLGGWSKFPTKRTSGGVPPSGSSAVGGSSTASGITLTAVAPASAASASRSRSVNTTTASTPAITDRSNERQR